MRFARFTMLFSTIMLCRAVLSAPVTEVFESFEVMAAGGPTGPLPVGWVPLGFQSPAATGAEQTQVTHGQRAFRYSLPIDQIAGSPGVYEGGAALLRYEMSPDRMARRPVDWTQPITIAVDIVANDPSVGGGWKTVVDLAYVFDADRSHSEIEWGDNGETNGVRQTAYVVLGPGAKGQTGPLVIAVSHDFQATDSGTAVAIFDNLRITYTPLPQPEVCDNGVDDDLDGRMDCQDSDCAESPACPCNPVVVFDVDGDDDVDQSDFAAFQLCLTGPSSPDHPILVAECRCFDVAGPEGQDNAIDLHDYEIFLRCMTGPAVAAGTLDPACDD